jgi:hypothetical protein
MLDLGIALDIQLCPSGWQGLKHFLEQANQVLLDLRLSIRHKALEELLKKVAHGLPHWFRKVQMCGRSAGQRAL